MRTAAALTAAILVADSAAQASGETQTLALDKDSGSFTILPSSEFAHIIENVESPFAAPLLSIYPDGRVELYRHVALPKEVPDVH